MAMKNENLEVATLGGGCFWCLEAVYDELRGVKEVVSGYMGGHVPYPTYEQVCGKNTGHVEVVQVTFDPSVVSFKELLQVFFTIHDPTTMNRQGNDVGPQYRSAIFYHSDEQKQVSAEVMAEVEAEKLYSNRLVTEVTAADVFYRAEEYHQNYFANNRLQPYCMFVVAPKVGKFRKKYFDRLKK